MSNTIKLLGVEVDSQWVVSNSIIIENTKSVLEDSETGGINRINARNSTSLWSVTGGTVWKHTYSISTQLTTVDLHALEYVSRKFLPGPVYSRTPEI